eukprot:12002485-Alexandrium_andersonii.AAC.1
MQWTRFLLSSRRRSRRGKTSVAEGCVSSEAGCPCHALPPPRGDDPSCAPGVSRPEQGTTRNRPRGHLSAVARAPGFFA